MCQISHPGHSLSHSHSDSPFNFSLLRPNYSSARLIDSYWLFAWKRRVVNKIRCRSLHLQPQLLQPLQARNSHTPQQRRHQTLRISQCPFTSSNRSNPTLLHPQFNPSVHLFTLLQLDPSTLFPNSSRSASIYVHSICIFAIWVGILVVMICNFNFFKFFIKKEWCCVMKFGVLWIIILTS